MITSTSKWFVQILKIGLMTFEEEERIVIKGRSGYDERIKFVGKLW